MPIPERLQEICCDQSMQMYKNFTDDEIKAIFAYLETIHPVKNIVPAPLPPAEK